MNKNPLHKGVWSVIINSVCHMHFACDVCFGKRGFMKKVLKLIMALALVLVVLSACGADDGNGYEPVAPPPDEVVTDDYLTNGYEEDVYTPEAPDEESEADTDAGATPYEEPYEEQLDEEHPDEEQPETDADAGATP